MKNHLIKYYNGITDLKLQYDDTRNKYNPILELYLQRY